MNNRNGSRGDSDRPFRSLKVGLNHSGKAHPHLQATDQEKVYKPKTLKIRKSLVEDRLTKMRAKEQVLIMARLVNIKRRDTVYIAQLRENTI